jgi:3-hydroxymyristoyl/3-hydroxydecanoyl-(acyl carrier protein) dehydratase
MCPSATLCLAADHPTAAGHFPGNPIIPGAVLLDEVIHAIGNSVSEIRAAKFLHPVRPGEAVTLDWQKGATGEIKFTCALAATATPVLTGALR